MRLARNRARLVLAAIAVASLAAASPLTAQVWTPLGPVTAEITGLAAHPTTGGRLLAATGGTLYLSDDEGASWTPVLTGSIRDVAVSPADPSVAYAIAERSDVFRSEDGGLTWEPSLDLGPDHILFRLWADPVDPDVAYFTALFSILFTEDPSYIFRTGDRGLTWDVAWSGALVTPFDLAFGSGLEPVYLADLTPEILLRSEDRGLSWTFFEPIGLDGAQLGEIESDPATAGRFLASSFDGELFESLDAGDTWHPYGAGLPTGEVLRLLFDRSRPGTVYAIASGLGGFRSADGGATWTPIGTGIPADRPAGVIDPSLTGDPERLYIGSVRGVLATDAAAGAPCQPGPTTLCLRGGRFAARVAWEDFQGGSGDGQALPLTSDTGAFWFFDDQNLELFVKVLDGTPVNGFYWVFYGSLSNVGFTLTVTDTLTGEPRVYENPSRTFASHGDTTAF